MKLTTVLFDLDGTLLPMDNDAFTKGYFKLLAAKLAPHGYDARQLVDGIWAGTAAMVANDGSQSNEAAFWKKFAGIFGEKALADKPLFDEFYEKEFQTAKGLCGLNPNAAIAVHTVKEMGLRVALATNPIFPAVAPRAGFVGLAWSRRTWNCTLPMRTLDSANPTPTTTGRSPNGWASGRRNV